MPSSTTTAISIQSNRSSRPNGRQGLLRRSRKKSSNIWMPNMKRKQWYDRFNETFTESDMGADVFTRVMAFIGEEMTILQDKIYRGMKRHVRDGTLFSVRCGAHPSFQKRKDGLIPCMEGGCGEEMPIGKAYRCVECTSYFHRECACLHFKDDKLLESIRTLNKA